MQFRIAWMKRADGKYTAKQISLRLGISPQLVVYHCTANNIPYRPDPEHCGKKPKQREIPADRAHLFHYDSAVYERLFINFTH